MTELVILSIHSFMVAHSIKLNRSRGEINAVAHPILAKLRDEHCPILGVLNRAESGRVFACNHCFHNGLYTILVGLVFLFIAVTKYPR